MPTTDPATNAQTFLSSHSIGVLSTLSPEGAPHARTMYYAADDHFNVYFLTTSGTRKVVDIAHRSAAAFVVSNEDGPQTIQIEGMVTDCTDTATINPVTHNLLQTLRTHGEHFAPVTHLDMGTIRFYKLTPTWVRWGDFTQGQGTDAVLVEIPL